MTSAAREAAGVYRFGLYEPNLVSHSLFRVGVEISLTPKVKGTVNF